MTLKEFEKIKENQLLTIRNDKGVICDVFHYSKVFELRHHNYGNEDYYYLSMSLQPKLKNVSITTKADIKEFYNRKKEIFNKQLNQILELEKEL